MAKYRDKLIRTLRQELRLLRVDESLLLLTRALSASRGEVDDPIATEYLGRLQQPLPPFVIHLLAKLVLRYGRQATPRFLDWQGLMRVLPIALELAIDDPVADSSDGEISGMLIRMMNQQMARLLHMQCFGLAIGIFQDLDATKIPGNFDVREAVESALHMPVELFMRMAILSMAASQAAFQGIPQPGTMNRAFLESVVANAPSQPWMDRWQDFARVVACDQAEFNRFDSQLMLGAGREQFLGYERNPLASRPLIDLGHGRYICIDNRLLWQRASWGLFQDAYDKHRKGFQGPFGHAFQRFVGELLMSVLPKNSLWDDQRSPKVRLWATQGGQQHKLSDFVYHTPERNVFIECKSARSSIDFVTFAGRSQQRDAALMIAKALRQLVEHADAVGRNEWADEGLAPRPATLVVTTMGRIETINGLFLRPLIDAELAALGVRVPKYLILSIEELDSLVWLVECGIEFGQAIERMATAPSFDPLQQFSELKSRAISTFAMERTKRLWDFLPKEA